MSDDNATGGVCESGGGPARGWGTGEISADGSTIHVTFKTLRCLRERREIHDIDVDYVHDADTDTLSDPSGVIWHRP